MRAFKEAVEAKDIDAMLALLADDVVFRSPAVHSPYAGKPATSVILASVVEVFEDFRYTREAADGDFSVLVFEARVGELQIEGADFITEHDGKITDLRVMIRPLKGLQAVVEAMGAQIPKAMAKLAVTPDQMKG